jgi:hypothetical protein
MLYELITTLTYCYTLYHLVGYLCKKDNATQLAECIDLEDKICYHKKMLELYTKFQYDNKRRE